MPRILVIICLVAIARGQVVRTKPATERDNAATLYALAVAELERGIRSGAILAERARVAQVGVGQLQRLVAQVQGGRLQGGRVPQGEQVEDKSVENSVLARSLFHQAATRPTCRFGSEFVLGSARDSTLLRLVELVHQHGRGCLARKPLASCEDACVQLRYVRHRLTGIAAQQALTLGWVNEIERQALQLLHDGLLALRNRASWPTHAARYRAELEAHAAIAVGREAYVAMMTSGIPKLVEVHLPRLRDMHMNVAGGFDADAMTKRLQAIAAKIFAEPAAKNMSFAEWLRIVDKRVDGAMNAPADDASITEKATYGMVQLIFMGQDSLIRCVRKRARLMESCWGLLDAPAKK